MEKKKVYFNVAPDSAEGVGVCSPLSAWFKALLNGDNSAPGRLV